MDLGSIVVRIGADTSQLDHAVDKASKALQGVEKAVQSASTATQKMDTVTSQAAKQMNDLEKAADKTAKAVQGVGQTYEKVARGGQSIEISSDQLRQQLEILQAQRRAREEMGVYEDDTYRATSNIGLWWANVTEGVQNNIAKIGKGWDGFAKGLDTISKGLRKTGRELTKYLTAPLMLVGGLAFNAALKVDDAMDFIAESTGTTGAQLASLQDSFRNLGRTSASNLMDVGAVTADLYRKFGLEGQALESVGAKVLDLARLTRENTGQMEQAWSQMVRNWSVDATQYESTLDKLMIVHQKTGVGVGELSNAMVDLGPLLRGMGYNWDQAAAFIGNFYKAGVDTGNLMFGIRNAVNEFAELSLDPKTTLMAYVRAIEQATTESEALAVAQQIFGQRSGPLFADAIRRGAIQIDELVAQLAGAEGAIAKTNEQTWGWAQTWAQFKNKAQFALEPLGNTLVKIAEDNLPGLANSIDGILQSFSSWPVSTQESVVKGLVLLAGLGPGLSAVAGALTAVKTIVAALSTSLGAAVIGFVLAGAGITMLVNKMKSTEEQLKAAPAFKFSELDKVTQGQFATAADILRSKEPDRAKQVAGMLGVTTQQLVDEKVIDSDSKLLMTDQTQLLDTLVALWQGKTQTMADAMAQTAGTSGLAISEEMAKGLLAGSPEFMKALEKMLKDADAYLPHSNAKRGPFSRLTQSGVGFIDAWAAGVLGNNAAVDAVSHTFAQVARLMPHSDAERGPLADITGSGKAFSQTFAKGILAEADVVSKATEQLGRLLMGRTESLNTRYVHNLRVLRDSTDNLWWQTASIPGAAMRYAADDVLANMDNMQPKMTLELDEDLLKLLPENMQGLLTNKIEEQLDGPLTLALDADLQPKFEDKTIRGRIEAALAALGPLSAKFELTLDETGIKSYGENILSLSSLLKQVPPLLENIGTAGQGMQLTIDKNLMRLTQAASDTEQAWLHLDDVVPKVGNQFELTMGSMSTAGQGMQLSLDKSLTQLTSSNAQAATETASTWEKVKATLGTTWNNIVSKLQGAGIDMQSIMKKTGTGINQEAKKVDSVWAQLAMYTAIRWASINGGVEEAIKKLAAWLPPELQQAVVGPLQQAFQQIGTDSKAGMKRMAQQIMDNLAATHPFIASTVKKLEEFVAKVQNMPGPIGNALKGVATAFKTLGEAIQKSFGEMAANALITYFDQLAAGEKTLQDFRGAMKAFLLDFVTMVEKQVLAAQAAGIATAIAQAPMTFGASLAQIPPILAQAAASLAVFESIKALIRAIPDNADQGVPALASGGIVTKPTMALIGEAGPEAVVPLGRGRGMGSGVTVVVNVTGNTIMGDRDADALGRRVAQSITDQLRQAGVRPAFSY